ncbi:MULTISPECIES: dimethylsulfonioproprionate lyase family protein [unclassified Ruegeria]|uniref:dimethylsulfonioproprionate lyase family protein n=1 Tax=unclassified Ruegeria TaxID=2625375 RepID=UPI001489EA54|nr:MULTISPECIES: dimethylsulfonioproprionate lyase family protein [unclassified Ruegeria]
MKIDQSSADIWDLDALVMAQDEIIQDMLVEIAKVYETEVDIQGPHTANTLLVTPTPVAFEPVPPCSLDAGMRAVLANSSHPAASSVLAAQHLLSWGSNPVEGNTQSSIAALISVLTLMGPEGPIPAPDVRLGLVYMRPDSYYPMHLHDADETYVIIAGQALWTAGDDIRMRGVGSMIHHPSMMPHAFRTGAEGFIAIWRWSGDINTHSYTFTEHVEADLLA